MSQESTTESSSTIPKETTRSPVESEAQSGGIENTTTLSESRPKGDAHESSSTTSTEKVVVSLDKIDEFLSQKTKNYNPMVCDVFVKDTSNSTLVKLYQFQPQYVKSRLSVLITQQKVYQGFIGDFKLNVAGQVFCEVVATEDEFAIVRVEGKNHVLNFLEDRKLDAWIIDLEEINSLSLLDKELTFLNESELIEVSKSDKIYTKLANLYSYEWLEKLYAIRIKNGCYNLLTPCSTLNNFRVLFFKICIQNYLKTKDNNSYEFMKLFYNYMINEQKKEAHNIVKTTLNMLLAIPNRCKSLDNVICNFVRF